MPTFLSALSCPHWSVPSAFSSLWCFSRCVRLATEWHRFLFLKCLLSVLLLIHPRYYYSSASSQILSWHKFKGSMSSILPTFSSYFSDPSRKQMTWGTRWLKWLWESSNSHFPYAGIKMGLHSFCFTCHVTLYGLAGLQRHCLEVCTSQSLSRT